MTELPNAQALGARRINRGWLVDMEDAGVQVEWFRSLSLPRVWRWNHRTHRKVMLCDEKVAFTGGVGIADEWTGEARNAGEWRDTHFRVTGPAVDGLRAAFISNWAETGRPVGVRRGPLPDAKTSPVMWSSRRSWATRRPAGAT